MSKHLSDLRDRRLVNLDSAIEYYLKRKSAALRARSKLPIGSVDEPLFDLEIKLLEDVVSYLKLC